MMRIDEATINHNAARIIRALVKTSYEVSLLKST